MRSSDADILIIPGFKGSEPEHWQSRWEAKLPTARRVIQDDWERPGLAAWRGRILEEVARARRPVILVAHSLGVLAAAHAAPIWGRGGDGGKVKGGFLVAPPSAAGLSEVDNLDPAFFALGEDPLPFPAVIIASRNDPYSSYADSESLAGKLGAELADAGFSGHINAESGHGPWPEGLLRFAAFLKTL
ncbi:MAG: alpha/beta fold hydrolase [Beijerinckiaceae bacterium]|nr:alpha/beta fold hydrolase [Beijerinckiaceae bacterium]